MRKFISILILISIVSCGKVSETEIEINAVQEVLNFYNGQCLKSKGFETLNGVEKKYYEIEISKSPLLNQDSKNVRSHSGNIAYLFYSNLLNEKSNYNEIRVKIILENGGIYNYSYYDKELKEIESLKSRINEISKQIVAKEYDELLLQFDKTVIVEKQSMKNLFEALEMNFGKISTTQFQGFEIYEKADYGEIIEIKEALVLEKVNAILILNFNRKSKQLIGIEIP